MKGKTSKKSTPRVGDLMSKRVQEHTSKGSLVEASTAHGHSAIELPENALHPETTLARAYLIMEKLKCKNLPVVSDDHVVGVISERDIVHLISIYSQGVQMPQAQLKVGNYMKGPVKHVSHDHEMQSVLRMMLDHRVGAVVITRDNKVVTSLTRDDMLEILAKLASESKSKVIDHLRHLIKTA